MEIKVGDFIDWPHGNSIRVAEVLEINGDKVLLRGATTEYWLSMKSLSEKLGKPYDYGVHPFSPNV